MIKLLTAESGVNLRTDCRNAALGPLTRPPRATAVATGATLAILPKEDEGVTACSFPLPSGNTGTQRISPFT